MEQISPGLSTQEKKALKERNAFTTALSWFASDALHFCKGNCSYFAKLSHKWVRWNYDIFHSVEKLLEHKTKLSKYHNIYT